LQTKNDIKKNVRQTETDFLNMCIKLQINPSIVAWKIMYIILKS